MTNPEEEERETLEQESQEVEKGTWERFATSPEGKQLISQVIDTWKADRESQRSLTKKQIEAQQASTRTVTWGLLLWTFFLAVVIIVPVTILAWSGKISSDAVALVIGTVIGATFTFLRGFFPRG